MKIAVRLRTPSGQERLEVDENATVADLVDLVREKTKLQRFSLKYGFPPKDLDTSPDALQSSLRGLELRGQTLVVAPETEAPQPAPIKGIEPDETIFEWPERGGYLALRVMPDDNSCLFTAFGGAICLQDPSRILRRQICEHIFQHPSKYTTAILGKDAATYTAKMMELDTWGGAIELSILSDIYDIEISSIDVKSLRIDKFGERKATRCIILYSGIHYDRIAFTKDLAHPVEFDETKFSTDDDEVLGKALELARKLKQLHYWTDTTSFVIKCEGCNWIGQGTRDAAKHERDTGHTQFGEMHIV